MNKELFVSATPHETRVALLEDGDVVEVYYEREKEYSLAGSIYKGRVTRVLPGMQSAFVDIGLDRDAFLYVSDFFEDSEEYDRVVSEAEDAVARLEAKPVAAAPAVTARPAAPEPVRVERVEKVEPVAAAPAPAEAEDEGAEGAEDPYRRHRRGRRRGRRGRPGLPDSKFARPEDVLAEPSPVVPEEEDLGPVEAGELEERSEATPEAEVPAPAPAAAYQALILPGESLAKYRNVAPIPAAAPPEALTAAQAPSAPETAAEPEAEIQAAAPETSAPAESEAEAEAPAVAESTEAVHPVEFIPPVSVPEWPETEPTVTETDRQEFEHERVQPDSPRERGRRRRGRAAAPEIAVKESLESVPEREVSVPPQEEPAAEVTAAPAGMEAAEESQPEARMEPAAEEHDGNADAIASASGPEDLAESLDEAPEAAGIEEEQADEEAEGEEGTEPEEEFADSASVRHQPQQARFEVRGKRRRRRRRAPNGAPVAAQAEAAAPLLPLPVVTQPAAVEPTHHVVTPRAPRLIGDLLHEGQEILVQIAKEPLGKKGARITSHLALPGRYLVYMPTVNHIGVSRKIASDEERARLKRLILENSKGLPGGFIVRTAGQGAAEEDFKADIRFLGNLWHEMRQQFERRKSPALLHHDLDLVERTLRDQLSDQFTHIWVDTTEQYQRVVRFVNYFMPHLTSRVRLYTRDVPMFEHFGVQEEINKGLKSKVWLKSGGYIVINQTEALVAIDVNTGKYVGKSNRLEDTIFKTNLDAIKEIVRQVRLRDLGGIIVIDFIDMDERRNRQKVMQALEEAMRADRAPSKVLSFNDFGLVALTRKRVKQSLERTLGSACPYCAGVGLVKSVITVCNEIYVEVRKIAPTIDREDMVLRVNPEVAKALKAGNAARLNELEEITGKTISVQPDALVHQEQFEIY